MAWQELTAGIIVGLAVVSLYRHLRGLLRSAAPNEQASCHGCDDCDAETEPPLAPPAPPGTRIH